MEAVVSTQSTGSWKTYVDTNLVGSGHVTQAAILDANTGATWAKSAGFPDISAATPMGMKESVYLVKDVFNEKTAQEKGIWCGKQKYMTLQVNSRSAYGKALKGGIVIVKTKKAVIVGIYDEKIQPGNATKCVEDLADYLIGVNY
eukprot:TRINITY_DN3011_c0_g1_i3.p1 TRINITY_DN3011_c0_g1~~TRINITY_DN3011_c0_g1_i3.p1  ORF type:complete len:145 (-),score=63.89 TRINITY_DN3011_c0_g1_i3:111-545(-)